MNQTSPEFTKQSTVRLPRPNASAFDYLVQPDAQAGDLVHTTLMNRPIIGMITGHHDPAAPRAKLKPIIAPTRFHYATPYREWLEFVARYTLADFGAVLALTGCSFALKEPRKAYEAPTYAPNLPTLSTEQHAALGALDATKPTLLDGVTGSGKTEVYFHKIAELLHDETAQILVMLPEIALTHQWLSRFAHAFGAAPALWHSKQSPAEKKRIWRACHDGTARVVVGARSALFLPYKHLTLIVVDEEHESAYKQEDGVLYHARDMAVARAQYERAQVILASATPSLETVENVAKGRYARAEIAVRHGGASLPDVVPIDMREEGLPAGQFISETLRRALADTLANGEQALLFLNRRGYAPLLLCRGCGHRFQCPNCSAWMVEHKARGQMLCHHCGHTESPPASCPECQAPPEKLVPCGPGVERIAEEVASLLPEYAPLLLSSDHGPDDGDFAKAISGEAPLLIGTQLVAKGHHFPKLTLVGVIDADLGLNGGDLRVSERAYQLLHQLAGRAGRDRHKGRVLLQSYQPDHPVMRALCEHGRDPFMQQEAAMRAAGHWPPYGQLAAILLDGPHEHRVRQAAQTIRNHAPQDKRLTILGPAPAPLSKLKGQYRFRILVKATHGIHLQKTMAGWLAGQQFPHVRVKVDMNPYDFL
jgi:primosomal protein N' (replication factor Y)